MVNHKIKRVGFTGLLESSSMTGAMPRGWRGRSQGRSWSHAQSMTMVEHVDEVEDGAMHRGGWWRRHGTVVAPVDGGHCGGRLAGVVVCTGFDKRKKRAGRGSGKKKG
ncbi:hypothetical protein SAY86_021922 [Trapa natans]|uniref:Uncharacterized protein n=1 Tax=Trapa natans TaxID=22666 RepID=A0AAN7M8W1_TRANT|nr:hypothetical protein SAY86_021922 [Trapa natans]